MNDSIPTITSLPTERAKGCPFDPPPELTRIHERAPISRLRFPDGHLGWLITGYALNRAVLGDGRFSSRYELLHHPLFDPGEPMPPAPAGELTGMDRPEHTRYRKLLTGKFTVRRMRLLTDRVEEITAERLDAMAEHGPPLDLVEHFAKPIPALMICELLGVPYEERESFQSHAEAITGSSDAQYESMAALGEYMQRLVAAKRADPTDDVLSDLTSSDLTDEELVGLGSVLLGAGLDTTANMLALGTFALLTHPEQLTALREDPDLTESAVEELMRYLTIANTNIRTALEDVDLDGTVVKAGETVILAMGAADRDPLRFDDPDRLDLARQATGHLAFGHGIHQCLGQQLARVEMRVAFPALVRRFPTLRLDVAPEDVPVRGGTASIHGVDRLPVAWDA